MKYRRYWLLLGAVCVVAMLVAGGVTSSAEFPHLAAQQAPPALLHAELIRIPNSFAKYQLCTEVFAFSQPIEGEAYKTDYSFHDPFRNAVDRITPHFLGRLESTSGASFRILIELRNIGTYFLTISHVEEKDGIALLLPDAQNHLQVATVPIFIVSGVSSSLAVLDYTCPFQWNWKSQIQAQ